MDEQKTVWTANTDLAYGEHYIFSTREKAEAFVAAKKKQIPHYYASLEIHEEPLDPRPEDD